MQNSVRVPAAKMTLAVIPIIPTILIPNPRKDRLTIILTLLVARVLAAARLPRFYNRRLLFQNAF